MRLRIFLSFPSLLSIFNHKRVNFVKFFFRVYWDNNVVFVSFLLYSVILIALYMLNSFCIPGINSLSFGVEFISYVAIFGLLVFCCRFCLYSYGILVCSILVRSFICLGLVLILLTFGGIHWWSHLGLGFSLWSFSYKFTVFSCYNSIQTLLIFLNQFK